MSQMLLHSDNLEICRLCLLEPEADRNVKFERIFPVNNGEDSTLSKQITEFLGIKIENDNNPNIICQHCLRSISDWVEMKKKAAESTIIIKYLSRSTFGRPTTSNACSSISMNSNNNRTSITVQIETNSTELVPDTRRRTMKVLGRKKNNVQKFPLPSTYKLFTCIKPFCNLIFSNFQSFKFHHRQHFEYGTKLMCWQCCVPFSSLQDLRIHQSRNVCRKPGMFKCFQCPEKFDDLESLSVHKFTFHNGNLAARRYNNKTITCVFCQSKINIQSYQYHLESCR